MLRKAFWLFLFHIPVVSLLGQGLSSSPYTSFGVGDLQFNGNAQLVASGRTGVAVQRVTTLNTQNPASYSCMKLTLIESGYHYTSGKISSATNSTGIQDYSFTYLCMGFPISQKIKLGASIGLLPFSSVGYKVIAQGSKADYSYTQTMQGTGGLNKVYFGLGKHIFKGLSVGANIAYMFGSIEKSNILDIPFQYNKFNQAITEGLFVRGLYADYGLQYVKEVLNKDQEVAHRFSAGLSGNMQQTAGIVSDKVVRSLGVGRTIGVGLDTILNFMDVRGDIRLPMSVKAGLAYEKPDKWNVAAEVFSTQWTGYSVFGAAEPFYKNQLGFNIGAGITPNNTDFKNYLKRIEYRIGMRYDNGNLRINGKDISTLGFSCGLGLPLPKSYSSCNISFEYYTRGTSEAQLLKEEYFRLMVGVTISDRWFRRYKYD